MAELTISSDEIRSALSTYTKEVDTSATREEVGTVVDTGDGIAHVSGLPGAMANELLEFPGGIRGVALNLDLDAVGAVILGDYENIEEGQEVKRTGNVLSVPVGDNFLGRVIDPLGAPIDGLGPIEAETDRVLELQAATVLQRQPVEESLATGIKAIDAMTAIGRGQRQLIIGDRKTGKTAVCIDAILNQKDNWKTGDPEKQVRCIYVAIGQKGSTIAGVKTALEEAGAMEYTTIVAAPASDSASSGSPLHRLGPGPALDVRRQARPDRVRRPVEAGRGLPRDLAAAAPPAGPRGIPGDVFYLHSRLLERAAKLSDEMGGGSMTALPIIETKANDVSAFIPTNVISITDGQVFLESDLFNKGVRPPSTSASRCRVGGAAQTKGLKKVSGSLRSSWPSTASWRPSRPSPPTSTRLPRPSERGARWVELLKQDQYSPVSVEDQIVSLYLCGEGFMDSVPVGDIRRFEAELLADLHHSAAGVYSNIAGGGALSDDDIAALTTATNNFREGFVASDGSRVVNDPDAPALNADDVRPRPFG